MRKDKCVCTVLAVALLVPASLTGIQPAKAGDTGIMRDISTFDVVEEMGIGINLGNTFESSGDWIAQWGDGSVNSYETAWGSPTITREIIQGYADEGFGVLRVPVAWSNLMSTDGSYTISPAYKARVRQVIDWALAEDMYVIMNLHWDGGWLENLPNDHDNCMKKYTAIWTQLCDEFRDYGDKLMFESQNEELYWQNVWNQWGGTNGKDKAYAYCNEVNQTFVNIVRGSGGNNEKRHLLISGYNTDVHLTCDAMFRMPSDPANRCAVSVHYYIPSTFAILEKDESWGKSAYTWGSDAEYAELSQNMDLLQSTFVQKGVPVIIGEYGCPTKNKEPASVTRFLSAVCEQAAKRDGICPVLWDITDLHYDRSTCKLKDAQLKASFDRIRSTYFAAKPPVIRPISGQLIRELKINDSDNAGDWSLQTGFQTGDKLYGDRDLTALNAPAFLSEAECIRTACDSKLFTGDLASFTAGADITLYAAVDARVNKKLDWLAAWHRNGASIMTSNGVALELFSRNAKAGEQIVLGTNGGQAESANYMIFAVPAAENPLPGDLDGDGCIGCLDMVLAQRALRYGTEHPAADVNRDGSYTMADAVLIQKYLLGAIREFPAA